MMNKINYLYFDDKLDTANAVKDNLENENLSITVEPEKSWGQIIEYLLNNENSFDGLILDWKLDGEDDSQADFSSEALAQQCRRLQVDKVNERGFSKSFPIILCSSQQGFANVYEKDTTGEDLFDKIYDKGDLEDDADFLISLDKAYKSLSQSTITIETILGLSSEEINLIDQNLIKKLIETKQRQPHETVQFLIKEVLSYTGALIGENVLAARLGVNKSSSGWELLKKEMSLFIYSGILEKSNRWWSDLIIEWWSASFHGSTLKFLTAKERIILLETKFPDLQGNLEEPELSEGAESKEFWTVCIGTNHPLAEVDGFIVDKHLHYSWQEKEYVCLNEAKDETNRGTKWESLLPYEEERLKCYFEPDQN